MRTQMRTVILTTLLGTSLQVALASTKATIIVQAGGFNATQGETQNIGINGLIGDQFTVNQTHGSNFLLGLGYYLHGFTNNRVQWLYGLNAFYLAPTTVHGNVIQEQFFNNLSYSYALTNYPIYVATRAIIHTNDVYNITFDLGVGPNIITTNDFTENSLDDGVTLPDNIFRGATSVAFSATAGVGIQFQHVLGSLPLEFGYRFFYLGEGQLNKQNDQVLNNLKTGDNYANAIIISTSF